MTVLVTGFDPFGPHAVNCSELLVQALAARAGVRGLVVPTCFGRAADTIIDELRAGPVSAVIMFGLAASSNSLRLERVARNRSNSLAADNDGAIADGGPIELGGPDFYLSTLPLETMADIAQEEGEAASWSEDAGGYVCNHTFYRVAHYAAHNTTQVGSLPCGFVHLPPLQPEEPRFAQMVKIGARFCGLFSP